MRKTIKGRLTMIMILIMFVVLYVYATVVILVTDDKVTMLSQHELQLQADRYPEYPGRIRRRSEIAVKSLLRLS